MSNNLYTCIFFNISFFNVSFRMLQVNSENNINGGTQQEYILDDDECPLAILMNHPSTRGKCS